MRGFIVETWERHRLCGIKYQGVSLLTSILQFCVKLSINNHIVGLVHKKTYYANASNVPRSLQS